MAKKNRRKSFHCKSEAQKRAIKRSYAIKAQQNKSSNPTPTVNKAADSVKIPPFKLPLKNGGHRWNIYKVPNNVFGGKNDGDIHGGLVIDEENNNVFLAQVTHSSRKGKRNNLPIRNLDSTDLEKKIESVLEVKPVTEEKSTSEVTPILEEKPKLRDSYLIRRLFVTMETKDGEKAIDIRALKKQMNDLQFTEVEKQEILDELSHLDTAEERYNLFKELAKGKDGT